MERAAPARLRLGCPPQSPACAQGLWWREQVGQGRRDTGAPGPGASRQGEQGGGGGGSSAGLALACMAAMHCWRMKAAYCWNFLRAGGA
jgi:hypothetical protein